MGFALGAGIVFNLANMLLVAAISVAGMAVAFPVGIGLALVIGVVWSFWLNPSGSPFLLFAGAFLVLLAIVVDALAYRAHTVDEEYEDEGSGFSIKGLMLALVSGVLMGSFYPLVEMSKTPVDIGLGPYSIAVFFAIGVFASTFIFNLYFMNLPVEGEPVGLVDYFRGGGKPGRNHLLGVLGGIIWCVGATCNYVAASAPAAISPGPAVSYAMGQGATLISALWGLLVWHEFRGAAMKVKLLLAVMLLLFVAGLGMVAVAPLYGTK